MATARCWCGSDCSTPSCVSCSGEGSCRWDCGGCGGCDGSCSGGCKSTCQTACNTGCSSEEATTLKNITLTTFINADNMTDIARLIYLEAQRRGKNPTSTSFTVGASATSEKMDTVVANLKLAGQTVTGVNDGDQIKKTFGQSLIDKAVAAYNQKVGLS